MELYYQDELHVIEKGYKKLVNSISAILKRLQIDFHHYPNIIFDQPAIKTNTHFPPLSTKSMLTTNNVTTTTLAPQYNCALLKNIGAAKSKENQMVVTAKNCNEKLNKQISTRTPTFPPLEKQSTTTTTSATAKTTTTMATRTGTTPVTVRKTITR